MIKTNKLILLIVLTVSSLLSKESDLGANNISSAIGFGSNGMVYRSYHNNGYVEYSGLASYQISTNDSRLNLFAGVNIGEYLYLSYNEDLDFSVKYVYGVSTQYSDSSSESRNSYNNSNASVHIMLGVELVSPNEEGFSVDIMMGQAIKYGSNSSIGIATTGGVQFMLNY